MRSMRLVGQRQLRFEPVPRVVVVPRVLRNVPYVSNIDPTFPVFGSPTTASVRDNFAAAQSEIEALQAGKLDLSGGAMTGPIDFIPTQRIDGGPL
jgi:hypothetical protein